MLKDGTWLHEHDIPGIIKDEDATSALLFFQRWKRMGFPYGPWGDNPAILVDVVDALEPLDRFYNPPLI